MSYQIHASKAILKVSIASVFVAVPGVINLTPPASSQIIGDLTEISDDDTSRGSIGRRETKAAKLTLKWDPQNSVHAAIQNANDADDHLDCEMDFELHYPDSTGLVEEWSGEPVEQQKELDKKAEFRKEYMIELKTKLTRTVS